ncbi:AAA family ATPase [Mesorhizobium neociceri]|uniref:ATP-binding protein n=1 Tax=Mesorhizobium neociceri TaxID=1307853 RepID=A0A838B3P4_9HYPH|nr:ATP-binding protein [Mesorhizobium neociceri]MBA1140697.1 ATP-binding protein [Mesorhizobium neociceri]
MDTRLANHLLWRLRHRAESDAIDHAVERGILVEKLRTSEGRKVRTFTPGSAVAGKSEAEILRLVQHASSAGSRSGRAAEDDEYGIAMEALQSSAGRGAKGLRKGSGTARSFAHRLPDTANLLRAVRRSAEPLRAVDVATMLLVAQSITMSATPFGEVLEALRVPSPIMTVTGRVAGFEEAFLDLLGRGLILPGIVAACKGYNLVRDGYGLRFAQVSDDPRWRVVTFRGQDFEAGDEQQAERCVAGAARSVYPILGVTESDDRLPELLRHAARINLTCGPIDMGIIRETLRAVLGEMPETGIADARASVLVLSDLALAIRPGTSVRRALDLLDDLARMRLASTEADKRDVSGKDFARRSSGTTASKTVRGTPGSGSERIEPAAVTGSEKNRFIPRVETLTGYGEAKEWALALKDDLALWRAGTLAWEDMSTKILLSGPPGTGKTQFAKALCNSLQIPLIASAVSVWLEPGYLGDVLKRMSAAFAEAEAAKPAILLIDEIDGIGKRGASGEWTSYWDSVVNRALELLDGAAKSDGVIVIGATNNPDAIDRALLRSGRLETHIPIPRPDTTALIGILRHHLKNDLDSVVASAPPRPAHSADAGIAETAEVRDAGSTAEKWRDPASRRHPAEDTKDNPPW